jgi:hypothetical protein
MEALSSSRGQGAAPQFDCCCLLRSECQNYHRISPETRASALYKCRGRKQILLVGDQLLQRPKYLNRNHSVRAFNR